MFSKQYAAGVFFSFRGFISCFCYFRDSNNSLLSKLNRVNNLTDCPVRDSIAWCYLFVFLDQNAMFLSRDISVQYYTSFTANLNILVFLFFLRSTLRFLLFLSQEKDVVCVSGKRFGRLKEGKNDFIFWDDPSCFWQDP